jgi:hypothetical protein
MFSIRGDGLVSAAGGMSLSDGGASVAGGINLSPSPKATVSFRASFCVAVCKCPPVT